MPRYIDADALLKTAYDCIPVGIVGRQERLLFAEWLINNAPTVSPEEVRGVGRWIEVEQPMGWRDEPCAECSVCGEDFVLGELDMKDIRNLFRFCPNCGAKMEVEGNA